jgi:hypothetical protein
MEDIIEEATEYRTLMIGDFHEGLYRLNAALAVLGWLESKEYSFDALDALVQAVSGTDVSEDLSDEEQIVYAETMTSVGDCLVYFGADPVTVQEMFDEEDADRAARIAEFINESPEFVKMADTDLIESFVTGKNTTVEEAMVKKVVNGKIKWVKKKLKKKRMSSAQKAGLKKARRKANSGAAKRNRAKSMKKRKALGM